MDDPLNMRLARAWDTSRTPYGVMVPSRVGMRPEYQAQLRSSPLGHAGLCRGSSTADRWQLILHTELDTMR